jgi:hypothetical protein
MQRSGPAPCAFALLAYRLPILFQRFPYWFPILGRRFHSFRVARENEAARAADASPGVRRVWLLDG